jgi:hypothetical protein
MPRTLLDLANSMEAKAKDIAEASSTVAVQTALIAVKALIERTPVDTSTALSNWQVSLDAPKLNFINAYVPGYLGYTAAESGAEALRRANETLQTKRPGQTIYISNNAPYIRDLNSGTSKQAPAGFVEASLLIARKKMPKVKLGNNNG